MRKNQNFTIEKSTSKKFSDKVNKEREKQPSGEFQLSMSNRVEKFMNLYTVHGESIWKMIKK